MINVSEPAIQACPRCGARLTDHQRHGFCSRCAAEVSLAEGEKADVSEEELAAILPSTALASSAQRTRFGDYELLEEIARGGMGVVYRARQRSLNRVVAVKMVLFGGLAGAEGLRRFRTEAAAASALDHPNIVRILDVGEHAGQPFLAMEYIAGYDLAHLTSEHPLGSRPAAVYVEKVARAVEFAHQHGILHRDLKPSNVMVDAFDEPRITDFGLAKRLDNPKFSTLKSPTLPGQSLGSPNFMPPEQAAGDLSRVGPASDVYGLGAILYHLLTGRPPFLGDTFESTLRQVLDREPISPRQFNPRIPVDLETICLKCLEKESEKRYQTAEELAEELRRFLNDQPIRARAVTLAERTWRWCRRNPVLASFVSVSLLLLLVVATGGPIAAVQINRQRRLAELRAYTADMNVVQQAWEAGNLRRAGDLLRAHIPKRGEPDLRGFEWRYLWNLCRDESRFSFTNFPSSVRTALSPDGRLLAAGSGQFVSLLDYSQGRKLSTFPVSDSTGNIAALAFSPTNSNMLATSSGTEVSLWNLENKRVTVKVSLSNSVAALAISPDGKFVAAGSGHQRTLTLLRSNGGSIQWERATTNPVFAVVFTPDGQSLVSGGDEKSNPLLWNLATAAQVAFSAPLDGNIETMALSPDRNTLATGSTSGTIRLWDLTRHKLLARLAEPGTSAVDSIAFSPDGQWLVAGCDNSTILLWDAAARQRKAIFRGHESGIISVVFSPDGQSIISSSFDRTVKIWDREPRTHGEILAQKEGWLINSSNFSPDGRRLASYDFEGNLTVWDVSQRRPIVRLESTRGPIAAFSPDGRILAQALESRTIRLWDAKTFELLGELTNGFDAISLSYSPDSRTLAAAGLLAGGPVLEGITNRLSFWDLATKRRINKLAAAAPLAVMVSFSHDGRLVAVGYLGGEVRLWDYQSEKLIQEFKEQHERIWAVAFSPDDAWLVAGGWEGIPFFYDLRARRALRPLTGTSTWVAGLCFSPDGKTVASAEGDGTVNLWNVATREIALTLRGHSGWLSVGPCFSPDGNLLATSAIDGTVRLWPAASFQQIAHNERTLR